jgi:hypothetical protein
MSAVIPDNTHESISRPIAMFADADNNPSTGALGGREADDSWGLRFPLFKCWKIRYHFMI